MIYKSYKESQERKALERALLKGQLPSMSVMGKGGIEGQQQIENLLSYYRTTYGNKMSKKAKMGMRMIFSESITEHRSITSVCSSGKSSTTVSIKRLYTVLMVSIK